MMTLSEWNPPPLDVCAVIGAFWLFCVLQIHREWRKT